MEVMFPATSASILKSRAIPKPQMVWDGKRSPIKFLIIISPVESGGGGGLGAMGKLVCGGGTGVRSEDGVGG